MKTLQVIAVLMLLTVVLLNMFGGSVVFLSGAVFDYTEEMVTSFMVAGICIVFPAMGYWFAFERFNVFSTVIVAGEKRTLLSKVINSRDFKRAITGIGIAIVFGLVGFGVAYLIGADSILEFSSTHLKKW